MKKILIVEDDKNMADLFCDFLADMDVEVECVISVMDTKDAIRKTQFDVILLDNTLPDGTGIELLEYFQNEQINTEVVMITGQGSLATAVKAMQLGARDFIIKPTTKQRLTCTLSNIIENRRLHEVIKTYEEKSDRKDFSNFVGASLPMQSVYQIIESAAVSKATVFITGESGTGKELCAEALHRNSPRRSKAFCAVNCGAIPRELMESEIFGHVKGAFTGANVDREGLAHKANGGTLFLDEICEMDIDLQTKLLRFIQTGTFQKVGGNKDEKVDVRFVCATNRDPLKEVQAGNFREDLYYRLHVLPISMPALRERGEDVMLIAQHFLEKCAQEEGKDFKAFDEDVRYHLLQYSWPGNVRQLQNVVWNIVVLNQGESITMKMLPSPLDTFSIDHAAAIPMQQQSNVEMLLKPDSQINVGVFGDSKETIVSMDELEKLAIENALSVCDGNVSEAAHFLNVSSATLYRKKSQWKKDA
jgi:two-component system repressor protein LuxO